MSRPPATETDTLRARAEALHLHGLLTHWTEVATQPWLAPMLDWEEQQRASRSLERRLKTARIGRFKPLCVSGAPRRVQLPCGWKSRPGNGRLAR